MKLINNIILLLLLVFMILGSSTVTAFSYGIESPSIRVVTQDISPEPVEPGQDVVVKISLYNEGSTDAKDVSLKLNTNYPFFVKTDSGDINKSQTLCAGCSMDNTYYIVVDANAHSGIYPLDFEILRDGLVIKPVDTININVIGKPDLVLETKQITPNIASGDTFNVSFLLKNIGTGTARNIKIIPNSDDFLMIGSNINVISDLNPDEDILFTSQFVVRDNLIPDTYKFPIDLTYVGEKGNTYSDSYYMGLNILNRADVGFQSIKYLPQIPTLVDQINIDGIIENTGSGDAEKVTIELTTPSGQTYKTFVGRLELDDDAPFYFSIKPSSIGEQNYNLKVTYLDDFGTHNYSTDFVIDIKKPTSNIIFLVIGLVLVFSVGIFLIYKKKKQNN